MRKRPIATHGRFRRLSGHGPAACRTGQSDDVCRHQGRSAAHGPTRVLAAGDTAGRFASSASAGRQMGAMSGMMGGGQITSDLMRLHPAPGMYREIYPRRNERHQNWCSRAGDEQSAAPDGV